MRNGLYSLHVTLLDGPGKGSGVFVLHDGKMLGGNGLVWLAGTYTFDGRGKWKGELINEPYAFVSDPTLVFEYRIVSIGFSGTNTDDAADTLNTGFVGKRSIAFRTTIAVRRTASLRSPMRWLAEG